MSETFRSLPAVHKLLEHPSIAPYESLVGRDALRSAVAQELDRIRAARADQPAELIVARIVERVEELAAEQLVPLINATGTLLHTNLGRAPIAKHAFGTAWQAAKGYSNLEFDLAAGERGSRYERVTAILRELTGAEDALVVNNCAAAILLILDTFARGAETIVARNQLIEIGGGFRLPDVLARSGSTLVEVGSTNKVYLDDFEGALSPRTALIMRSHRSNFSIEGFTSDVLPSELVSLGKRAGIPVVEDLGSGALVDLSEFGLPRERTVQEAVNDGMALTAFSGDKLFGGPQAGIIVGRSAHVARLRSNPLLRALRVDKVTLGLIAGTAVLYRSEETRKEIPFYRMLSVSLDELRERASIYVERFSSARAVESEAYVGGGSLPNARIPSIAVALRTNFPDALATRLRRNNVPIVARVEGECVLLDLRTVAPESDAIVLSALTELLSE